MFKPFTIHLSLCFRDCFPGAELGHAGRRSSARELISITLFKLNFIMSNSSLILAYIRNKNLLVLTTVTAAVKGDVACFNIVNTVSIVFIEISCILNIFV